MYDTMIAVVGNALTLPEWRRFERTNALVANFKIASTSRRFDRNTNRWIDGDSLRLRVNCWRRLAEGVVSSIKVGDPVVVTGRLYTREWQTEDGQRRTAYELEAVSVGHDLARGVGVFRRGRANLNNSVVEDEETDNRVNGQPTEPAPEVTARSEALTADLDADGYYGRDDEPAPGYDGPISGAADPSPADLGTVLSGEVPDDLHEVIAQVEADFGTGTGLDGGADAAAAEPADAAEAGTAATAAVGVEAAADEPHRPGADPVRGRRGRARVAANA